MTLPLSLYPSRNSTEVYIDARTQGYQGPSRSVRLVRATPSGGGAIARSEDGLRCAVTGKESLKIIRAHDPSYTQEHKFSAGPGGHRLEASRNLWEGSGLKIDCASTDVAWGYKQFDNKILTSARNGELIMWDLNKSGPTKYERRAKDHIRSINKISVSHVVENYCITGSADGYLRVWDMRSLNTSIMRIHHPTSVRTLVFSPSLWLPLQAAVGLDNGSIIRWDLRVGQRGQLDKLAVAHSASVTTLDWRGNTAGPPTNQSSSELAGNGLGWIVSGGLDRCVKIWDLTAPGSNTRISPKPTYILHPSFPVRRVLWRPSYECEIALVSNTEFATKSSHELTQNMIISGNLSGTLTRVGSSYNLESLPVRSLSAIGRQPSETFQQATTISVDPASTPTTGAGDAVEIWDVRRGWIAKWAIPGSSVEGGVTDVAFRDAHSLWAQHSSGTFSQVDLRETVRPLDAIPRSAVSWDASGSLAFVADRAVRWETPYDDSPLEQTVNAEDRKGKTKALGDSPYKPETQSVGTFVGHAFIDNLESFVKLARGYVLKGPDRSSVCLSNAQVAFNAGREDLAQMWLLMAASLTECMPTVEPTAVHIEPPEPSLSLPVAPSNYVFPVSQPEQNTTLLQRTSPNIPQGDTPHRLPQKGSTASTPRGLTPTSSTASSPRILPGNLPPVLPRRTSLFGRRESVDSSMTRMSSSLYRRPSLSSAGVHGSSPNSKNNPSLRHVGEGVLDDSDSSGEGEDTKEVLEEDSSEDDLPLVPLVTSPRVHVLKSVGAPSPLSQVVKQQGWAEDDDGEENNDDDEVSPSPGSTDTESSGDDLYPKRPRSMKSRRDSFRVKSRSRSSTVASLAAPKIPHLLAHQESFSSIRTVTAGEVSFREVEFSTSGVKSEEPTREPPSAHSRQKSQALSDLSLGFFGREQVHEEFIEPHGTTERRADIVWTEEERVRELGWEALRTALEELADQGDVQTCAMMSIIAPTELGLGERRAIRFLESYVDILSRLKLLGPASYIRKFSNVETIQNPTTLQTTIYTACGTCRKPLLIPAGSYLPGEVFRGGFTFCMGCKVAASVCTICRLPVKGLLFECPVCTHGGHQACYRDYYGRRPMVNLPRRGYSTLQLQEDELSSPRSGDDETSTVSSSIGTIDPPTSVSVHQKTLVGHPCAAGCGHYCSIAYGGDA
ncbi:WD40 repeat-like protein [Pluteus cervinus]|uniref:WD40 repeat-like protein n=1 Tax=Pluteus cervinus TaxID=181527 RepID=A0ACD3AE79_9AGAR|nr:WD40 repeat-like protein [Pluteus cervinus]